MTVEEKRGPADQFPVGMRVLAVDDDPTCLKLLETLLRRCKYHVTATNQAIVALKLLRENKDKFDLVISDVHMPDMDGFKLLELVGLEMDLPVIMLSANSDPKAVMNGITHGACDYLLKPVRMEELKNIWQHVVRRRKFDSKDHSSYDHTDDIDKLHHAISEGGHDPATSTSSDRNGRLNRKRKDQNEDDDDECDDNGQESEDPSTQKKPRVVWSVELHRKFVAAVNQLGIDKAMPKRILDLMNVEKLTRENVASHLQKYRLYLKRISSVANQQANMVAALGGKDSPYLPMGALDGVRNYHAFTGSGQLSTLASFQQGGNGMLGRLNSPTRPGLYGLGSSGMIQLGRAHNNVSNSIHDFGKLPQISFSGNQQTNLLQGMPTTLEPNQLQQQKIVLEPSNHLPNSFSDSRFSVVNSNNSFISVPNNAQILPTQQQQSNGFGTQSSNRLAVMTTDPFEMSSGISSNLPDLSRCTETWTGASPLNGFATNALPLSVPFSEENQLIGNMGSTISPIVSNVETNSHTVAPSNALLPSLPDPMMGRDFQCQADFGANTIVIPSHANESSDFSDIRSTGSSMQRWDGQRSIETFRSNLPCNPSSNPMFTTHGNINTVSHDTGFSGVITNKLMDMTMINQPISRAPFSQNCSSASDNQLKFSEDYNFDPSKLQGGFNSNNYNSFDDLMSAIVKQEREDILIDGDVGCDLYSLETCM